MTHQLPSRIAILGAGRSGLAAAAWLSAHGTAVFLSDIRPPKELDAILASAGLAGIAHEGGGHTQHVLAADALVISPGIPSDIPIVKQAHARGIPVWSEIELACRVCAAPVFAITGSSGKSTTVSLLGSIFKAAGGPAIVAGNIGVAAMSVIADASPDARVALEVSSFQLENIDRFHPHGAAVLNLMKNHLDRYPDEDTYYRTKMQIVRNMTRADFLAISAHDQRLLAWADSLGDRVTIVRFGEKTPSGDGVWCDGVAAYAVRGGERSKLFDVASMKIHGRHNRLNAAAAAAVAFFAARIPAAAIAEGVAQFPGLPHRLELAATVNGVGYYNDSKSTTAESMICALQAFKRGVHLIAGGRDKGCDFSLVNEELGRRGVAAYLIGEAADRITEAWNGVVPLRRARTLQEAVAMAHAAARPGDAVVLSPGCSSFDMFANYEERGEVFKDIVRSLARRETA